MIKKIASQRVVLLDSHAIIHRAYHALEKVEMTGPDGAPTGALYGLVSMILKIVSELKPDYLIACFDLPKPTIRHEAYSEYKGSRAKMDDSLATQITESKKVFEALSIPLYEKEGFEADDLLGTIAHQLQRRKEIEVVIASGDMDTLQLVGENVRVYTLKKGIQDTILYDTEAVQNRFGFAPKQITDFKGLRGDPSDNIKGVPGIGEKTATDLITQFGTIEAMYALLKKKNGTAFFIEKGIKARMVELLRDNEEEARFSKALATIRLDAPIAFALPAKVWLDTVDSDNVAQMCDTYGFRTLRERMKKIFEMPEREAPEEEIEVADEEIDSTRFQEAQIMLWLISSEFTNPSLDDILAFTKMRVFEDAYQTLQNELKKMDRVESVYADIEKPLIPVIVKMEERGVLVDKRKLLQLEQEYTKELNSIEKKIFKVSGREFNISSPKQLGEILFDEMHLIPEKQKKTTGGARSTRESELEKIKDAHPIVAYILEYRELKKLLSTYIVNMPPLLDGENRLHAEFVQTGTTTGRMSSQNPNLQNIPAHSSRGRKIREAFIAPKGFSLLSLDYSQIELRLSAILSGDEKLCAIFRSGRDVHREVASQVFHIDPDKVTDEMRRKAKIINFGILYGMGINALRAELGTTTAETHQFYDEYFGQFKQLAEYLESTKGFARKHGYTETLFGRRRQFPEVKSTLPYVRAQAERMAINAPIQGTQSDIIKLAMSRIDALFQTEAATNDAYLLLQVHDELIFEINEGRLADLASKIKTIMESVVSKKDRYNVPITVSMKTGKNWGELEPL